MWRCAAVLAAAAAPFNVGIFGRAEVTAPSEDRWLVAAADDASGAATRRGFQREGRGPPRLFRRGGGSHAGPPLGVDPPHTSLMDTHNQQRQSPAPHEADDMGIAGWPSQACQDDRDGIVKKAKAAGMHDVHSCSDVIAECTHAEFGAIVSSLCKRTCGVCGNEGGDDRPVLHSAEAVIDTSQEGNSNDHGEMVEGIVDENHMMDVSKGKLIHGEGDET
eukprot:TRINITY_DN72453_c0_g1_i1.p1 TRINITY_DN72453_c0_g1~~TRINITY_DN72453_c0_g1_i1.p1  ORF type:complete len:219 (+),score=42.17 TRINITY_DN72453_c0_g1_i1:148-804(+)